MAKIDRLMSELTMPDQVQRVVAWLQSKYVTYAPWKPTKEETDA